jgi:3-deoxy-D-manno-octulosonate 8-phosphate phosphatase (KDO 8-P phosphatase)
LQNPLQGVIYFGNDLNDIAVMRTCGFSVAPADAHPLVKREATITLPEVGGAGFLRSAIEGLIGAQDMSTSDLIALLRPPVLAPTNSNGT